MVDRPVKHLPIAMSKEESELYLATVANGEHLIEYGCGGSTLAAIQAGVKRITSIESDKAWVAQLAEHPTISERILTKAVNLVHVDIGETGEWGYPASNNTMADWPRYWETPWQQDTSDVSVVLVDGRFRVACAAYATLNARTDSVIVIHDFWNRSHYQEVLKFLAEQSRAGSLGIFLRRPDANDSDLREIVESYRTDAR